MTIKNPYKIEMVTIKEVIEENPLIRTLVLNKGLNFEPGQFILVSVLGVGEAPLSVSSYPELEISFKNVGNVTNALFKLGEKQKIGIRGPYGNPYPLEELKERSLILIAGGIGLAPIRSLIKYCLLNQNYNLTLFFGARNPELIPYKRELKKWGKLFPVHLTVDEGDKKWKGNVGFVTSLLEKFELPRNATAVFCGPPVMFKFTADILNKKGMRDRNMMVSFERNMRCGIGECGHCNIGNKLVCKDGPNFRWNEVKGLG